MLVEGRESLAGIHLDHHPPAQFRQVAPCGGDLFAGIVNCHAAATFACQGIAHWDSHRFQIDLALHGSLQVVPERRDKHGLVFARQFGERRFAGHTQPDVILHRPMNLMHIKLEGNDPQQLTPADNRRTDKCSVRVGGRVMFEIGNAALKGHARFAKHPGQLRIAIGAVNQVGREIRLTLIGVDDFALWRNQEYVVKQRAPALADISGKILIE